ncbi:cysteine-rich secretory protein 3-like isoform X2 [Styela clava]
MAPVYHPILIITTLLISDYSAAERQRRGTGPTIIPLTDHDKMEIVRHHNDLRRLGGASNMRFMTWDSELATIAEEHSKKCNFDHNKNRKHSRWSVGENIYATSGKMTGSDTTKAIQAWYDELKYFSHGSRTCQPGMTCGHYTQVMWATTFKVGCAICSCVDITGIGQRYSGSLFVCNYAPAGNIVSLPGRKLLPLFEEGKHCTKCNEDDYCRDSLCANSARDFVFETKNKECQSKGSQGAFIAVIIILCIIIVILVTLFLFRRRMRFSNNFGISTAVNHMVRFSNASTPATSAYNTPKHSLTGVNLHGISKLTAADISTPLELLKDEERRCSSAPTTPRRAYIKGTATPPKASPPVLPPPPRRL